mmetsp:Transcript_21979/g.50208  ORF Transcript_21979/g.50208 Transcript_21979/m.50208 type:complete len:236 (+) Transcript_21979:517-1224(+)
MPSSSRSIAIAHSDDRVIHQGCSYDGWLLLWRGSRRKRLHTSLGWVLLLLNLLHWIGPWDLRAYLSRANLSTCPHLAFYLHAATSPAKVCSSKQLWRRSLFVKVRIRNDPRGNCRHAKHEYIASLTNKKALRAFIAKSSIWNRHLSICPRSIVCRKQSTKPLYGPGTATGAIIANTIHTLRLAHIEICVHVLHHGLLLLPFLLVFVLSHFVWIQITYLLWVVGKVALIPKGTVAH